MKRLHSVLLLIALLSFMLLFCVYSSETATAVKEALKICADVLIPSLLPCIAVSNIIIKLNLISILPQKIRLFSMLVLSMVSGYPVGANLLNECVENGLLSDKEAKRILPSFINAGPGFIINVVGAVILNNKVLGFIIFVSQCCVTLFLFILFGGFKIRLINRMSSERFSNAVSSGILQSVTATKNICVYVIIFFSLSKILEMIFGNTVSKIFITIGEITSSVFMQNNIYVIVLLLSWSGLCVYMQILSVTRYKFSFLYLFAFRIIHGLISVAIVKLLITALKISVPAFSTVESNVIPNIPDNFTYLVIIIFSVICFLSSVQRKSSGKLEKDLL